MIMDSTYFDRESPKLKKCPYGIFVNQTGYFPKSKKTAVMFSPCEKFSVRDESGREVFSDKISLKGYCPDAGETVYTADFSELTAEGRYFLTAGNERSVSFEIGANVYDKVFHDTAKAFYYLRCGMTLEEKYAGVYGHKKCHTSSALLWEDKNVTADVSGGWHDAGDYGRYVTPGACAVAQLMYAYKLFPSAFEKISLDIPVQDNVPAILSECRYELEWLLKMQRSDGGVYHKVTTMRHAPFVMPEDDKEPLYIFPVSSSATCDFAAVCALASGIFSRFDPSFAKRLHKAAESACDFLEKNPVFIGFSNPEGCNTGVYGERDCDSNLFWAYSELYSLTGDEKYHAKLKVCLEKKFPLTAFGYTQMGGFGALAYLLCGHSKDEALAEKFKGAFFAEADKLKNIADKNAFGIAMTEDDYHWGSNMSLMQQGMVFSVRDLIAGDNTFRDYSLEQLNYLLGKNALGISFVTGNGEFRCNYPHLRPAYADGIEECIPGMVSGGPNRFPCDKDAEILIPKGTPPMKCYADDVGCYSLNEITVYWNSPAVFVLASAVRSKM